jgi:hypothetical protein
MMLKAFSIEMFPETVIPAAGFLIDPVMGATSPVRCPQPDDSTYRKEQTRGNTIQDFAYESVALLSPTLEILPVVRG